MLVQKDPNKNPKTGPKIRTPIVIPENTHEVNAIESSNIFTLHKS